METASDEVIGIFVYIVYMVPYMVFPSSVEINT